MKTVALRLEGANNSSSISAESSPRRIVLEPPSPEFEPPDPPPVLPDTPRIDPEPVDSDIPPIFGAAARRAAHSLGPYLRVCKYEEIWFLAIDHKGDDIGRVRVAQGGLAPVQVYVPDLLMKARSIGAMGIILLQNRPGPVEEGVAIDAQVSLQIALVCELMGLPLVDHIYINTLGAPFFVRGRGILKPVRELVATMRERAAGMAVKAWEKGLCDVEDDERKSRVRVTSTAAKASPAVEVIRRKRRA